MSKNGENRNFAITLERVDENSKIYIRWKGLEIAHPTKIVSSMYCEGIVHKLIFKFFLDQILKGRFSFTDAPTTSRHTSLEASTLLVYCYTPCIGTTDR